MRTIISTATKTPRSVLYSLILVLALSGSASAYSPDWTTISTPFYPLYSATSHNPVLTHEDVTDTGAYHVADPFLIAKDGVLYMFFEVAGNPQKISVAQSVDGINWQYLHVVISEPFSLSFPCVFESDGEYYIVPESYIQSSVRLYKAANFPDGWTFQTNLVSGRPFVDPSIFRYNNTWWMFVGDSSNQRCYLYFSDFLDHGWQEHPMSPIVGGDLSRARPAGRTVVLAGGAVYRLAQKCNVHYGEAVRCFAVDLLTRTQYAEHEVPQSPILTPGNDGWNNYGMHQCDPYWMGDHWIVAVDGISQGGPWCIGIYRTAPTGGTVAVPFPDLAGGSSPMIPTLLLSPSPFADDVSIAWNSGRSEKSESAEILISTVTGRMVRRLSVPRGQGASPSIRWDGTDAEGRPAASGTYFVRLRSQDGEASRTLIRLR